MGHLLFGTAGIPLSTFPQETGEGIRRISELGLDCMEIEFVQGIYLGESQAKAVAEMARNHKINLSVHAPYYLNFNAHDPSKLKNSQSILIKASRIAQLCGASSVVFHPGFYLKDSSEKAGYSIRDSLQKVIHTLEAEDINVKLRPESAGRTSQYGSIDEIIFLAKALEKTAPCVDFAHWHARSGTNNSYEEFCGILEAMRTQLGISSLTDMHIHVSGIEYGQSGEKKHLPILSSDLRYQGLMRALKDFDVSGSLICESPNREEDALLLKACYHKV